MLFVGTADLETEIRHAFSSGDLAVELLCDPHTPYDVALVDATDPEAHHLIASVHVADAATPVFAVVPAGAVDTALRALRAGATHYLTRPLEAQLGLQLVRGAERARAIRSARRSGSTEPAPAFVAKSDAALRTLSQVEALASAAPTATLISGEPGVGKELVAHVLHHVSRGREPFLVVDCAATGESQLELALFGREGGPAGALELASGGSVYISEVMALDPALQGRMVEVLRRHIIRRIGAQREDPLACRLIFGTSRDLSLELRAGSLLPAMQLELSVARIHVSPLRERIDDVDALVAHFVQMLNARLGRDYVGADSLALKAMRLYDWPGNVRELRNVVERAMILNRDQAEISVGDLPPELVDRDPEHLDVVPGHAGAPDPPFVLPVTGIDLAALERCVLEQALQRAGGNQTRAAALLRISRFALRHRLEKHGLEHMAHGQRGRPRKGGSA